MIVPLLLFLDVALMSWIIYCVVREAKPGGVQSLGFLSYRDERQTVPPAKK